MSFLLDTNICSEYLRRPSRLFHYFVQHSGRLHIASVSLSELFTWAYRQNDPSRILTTIGELREAVRVLPFDAQCAEALGRIRGQPFRAGNLTSPIDLNDRRYGTGSRLDTRHTQRQGF
jgi:predicted nucleic acid-binding protein